MKQLSESWQYLALRFLTLAVRFAFVALFFRYSEALYGEYGLVATTVALGIYVMGMEFYTYSHREFLQASGRTSHIFLQQLTFMLLAYALILPLFYGFFKAGFLDDSYLVWFYILIVLEHVSVELHRILFTLRKPLTANINLFFRNGFWMLPLLWYFYKGKHVDLPLILKFWIAGDILSVLIALAALPGLHWKRLKQFRPDPAWIKTGFFTGIPFFFAVLSLKIIEFSDRYFIDYFFDKETVGIYTFFGNLAILIPTVVVTAVISVRYPELMESILREDYQKFAELFKEFRRQIVIWTWITAAGLLITLPVFLKILGKEARMHYYGAFVLLTLAYALFTLSMIPHYILYGFKKDKVLLYSAVTAMAVNVGLNFICIPRFGIWGAAFTTLAAMAVLWGWKTASARKLLRQLQIKGMFLLKN